MDASISPLAAAFLELCAHDYTALSFAFQVVADEAPKATFDVEVGAVRTLLGDLIRSNLIEPCEWDPNGAGLKPWHGDKETLVQRISEALAELTWRPSFSHPLWFCSTAEGKALAERLGL